MSDATGFGSGGTSQLFTVGSSSASCNTTDPGVPWTYTTPNALTQCGTYAFVDYDNAIQPVTIYGLIPDGDIFTQKPPVGPTNFTWPAVNVASGTSVVFLMVDSQGRSGGVSGILNVLPANDATCINSNSPSSTASPPSSTAGGPSSTSSSGSSTGGTSASPAAIAATAAGAILLLAVLITLALFFLQKRKGKWGGGGGVRWGGPSGSRAHGRLNSAIDLNYDPDTARTGPSPDPYAFPQRRFEAPNAPPTTVSTLPSHYSDDYMNHRSVSQYGTEVSGYPQTEITVPSNANQIPPNQMTGAQRKAAMAQAERERNRMSYGSRVLVHTDLAEAEPDEHGVIELPPMYSANRAPLAVSTLGSTASSSNIELHGPTYPPAESTFTYSSIPSPMTATPHSASPPQNPAFGQHWS